MGGRDQFFRAYRAWSLARLARFDEARAILVEARAQQTERGGGLLLANLTAFESASVELLAGDPAAAAEFGVEGCRLLEELGQLHLLAAAGGPSGQAMYELDRLDDADVRAPRGRARSSDDVWTQMLWRQARAKILARRGEHKEAEQVAHEAVALSVETEGSTRRVTRTPTSPRCSNSPAGRRSRPPRSSRPSSATNARRTASWRSEPRRASPSCTT